LLIRSFYAAATFAFFHYLDKKTSGQAKKAISDWLKPRGYDKAAIVSALVEMFDSVYTQPLLRPRAFLRSALITTGVVAIALYEDTVFRPYLLREVMGPPSPSLPFWAGILGTNIAVDYVSLFIVRSWLALGRRAPFLAAITGPLLGALVVGLLFRVRDEFFIPDIGSPLASVQFLLEEIARGELYAFFLYSALAVHLWLPFLALCIVLLRVLDLLLASVGRMQWFLKQGQHHPLDALGYVASGLVFVGSALFQALK
jgi:hypothetical protein